MDLLQLRYDKPSPRIREGDVQTVLDTTKGQLIGCCLLVIACCLLASSCADLKPPSEEVVIAKKYWDKTVVKCSGMYFSVLPMTPYVRRVAFQAFADFSYTVEPAVLTEADHLNGIQWAGSTRLRCTSYRLWDPYGKRWSLWAPCSPFALSDGYQGTAPLIPLEKAKGKWFYSTTSAILDWQEMEKYNPAPMECAQFPAQ